MKMKTLYNLALSKRMQNTKLMVKYEVIMYEYIYENMQQWVNLSFLTWQGQSVVETKASLHNILT